MHDIMLSSILIINLNKALTYKNHNNYYLILTCVIAGARCVSSSIPTTTQTSSKLLISLPGSMLTTSLLFPVTPEANHITELGFNFLNKIYCFLCGLSGPKVHIWTFQSMSLFISEQRTLWHKGSKSFNCYVQIFK